MVTNEQCEVIANRVLQDFINECRPQDETDVKHVLVKIFSMAGLALVGIAGQETALDIAATTYGALSAPDVAKRVTLVKVSRH